MFLQSMFFIFWWSLFCDVMLVQSNGLPIQNTAEKKGVCHVLSIHGVAVVLSVSAFWKVDKPQIPSFTLRNTESSWGNLLKMLIMLRKDQNKEKSRNSHKGWYSQKAMKKWDREIKWIFRSDGKIIGSLQTLDKQSACLIFLVCFFFPNTLSM